MVHKQRVDGNYSSSSHMNSGHPLPRSLITCTPRSLDCTQVSLKEALRFGLAEPANPISPAIPINTAHTLPGYRRIFFDKEKHLKATAQAAAGASVDLPFLKSHGPAGSRRIRHAESKRKFLRGYRPTRKTPQHAAKCAVLL